MNAKPKPRALEADRYVGVRMRERRIMLGLTQMQMADLIGVTYQQAHKYEKGINRIASGRLYSIAQALGVDIGYFFEGLGSGLAPKRRPYQRELLELAQNFMALKQDGHREAVSQLARTLASDASE